MESTLGIPGGVTDAVPSGTIVMFHGSTIPTGWAICNGQNGTPDLRDRFIVGAGRSYNPGATGGSDTVTLSTNQIPAHSHTITGGSHSHTVSGGSHSHTLSGRLTLNVIGQGSSQCINPSRIAGTSTLGSSGQATADLLAGGGGTISAASPSMTCESASPRMTASNSGGGESHENRPPYYALYFIMKL